MKRTIFAEGDGERVVRRARRYTAEVAIHLPHPNPHRLAVEGAGVLLEVDPDGSWKLTTATAWDEAARRRTRTVVASGNLVELGYRVVEADGRFDVYAPAEGLIGHAVTRKGAQRLIDAVCEQSNRRIAGQGGTPEPRPSAALAPYHNDLVDHQVDPAAHLDDNPARDAFWYGALIAEVFGSALSPLDGDREFYPEIDAGFGEVAELVARTLFDGGTVVPRQVAEAVAADVTAHGGQDDLARLARHVVKDWQAEGREVVEVLLELWADLAKECARSWLRGFGGNPNTVQALDGEFSKALAGDED
jgi:hypothetical protein